MNEHRVHQVFQISVVLKGLHALIECIAGLVLIFVSTAGIQRLVNAFTQEELTEDPKDFVARHLVDAAAHFTISSEHFYAFYLLSHGIVKVFLVAGLLRNKFWAYPASLAVMGLFIAYQLYRYSDTHSMGLLALTIFDVIVIGLVWHEYQLTSSDYSPASTRRQ